MIFFLPHLGHKIQKLVHFWSYPCEGIKLLELPFNILSHKFLEGWGFLHSVHK